MVRGSLQALAVLALALLAVQAFAGLFAGPPPMPPPPDGGPARQTGDDEPPPDVPPWQRARPNFIIMFPDDQNFGTVEFMPRTESRLFDQGVTFLNAYITTPVCCPSRVSLLTGQLASHHRTLTNFEPIRTSETLPHHLKSAGYATAHVGKFLNTWDGTPRSEYDYWAAHGGAQSDYFDPMLNVNGEWRKTPGYITDIFADHAIAFVEQAAASGQNFALFWWPNAPHGPAQPDLQDRSLYEDLPPHRPPSLNEEDVSDKPQWLQRLPPVSEERALDMDSLRLRQLQTLASLDRAVDRLLDRVDALGIAENTVIFYMSDNGILTGEHRIIDKHYPYEEAIHVPFGMRYPALVREPRVEVRIVANIDIPATIYEMAGVQPTQALDGRSLVPLLTSTGPVPWRNHIYLEAWPRTTPPWQAIHTGQLVYIETRGDAAELYDMHRDPYQMNNIADVSAYAQQQARLKGLLDAERAPEYGARIT